MQDNSSIINAVLKRQEQSEKEKQIHFENIEEFKRHINSMFATDSGTLFAKYWLKEMGIYAYDDSRDGLSLVENKGAKRFYLKYIRPNLTEAVKHKIEGQL